jgi:hypothetical protein
MSHGNHNGAHAPGATHEPVVHDPEHDIDARSATIWFVAGALVLFVSLWLMLPIFIRVQETERKAKIYDAPTTELNDVKDAEHEFLKGANPTKKSIEDVLQKLAGK